MQVVITVSVFMTPIISYVSRGSNEVEPHYRQQTYVWSIKMRGDKYGTHEERPMITGGSTGRCPSEDSLNMESGDEIPTTVVETPEYKGI